MFIGGETFLIGDHEVKTILEEGQNYRKNTFCVQATPAKCNCSGTDNRKGFK